MPTVTYSRIGPLDIQLDYELPPGNHGALPAIMYIHGGGLVTGSRTPADLFFPAWLRELTLTKGFIFLSADHRLIRPSTAWDQIDDMKALFKFLASPDFASHLPSGVSLNSSRIGVVGVSGGSYIATLACLYAEPKPKALFQLFGMGGNLVSDHWVSVKEGYFQFPGAHLVTEQTIAPLMTKDLPPISDAPVKLQDNGSIDDDGGRGALMSHWWKTGEYLDHILGRDIASTLRALPESERIAAIPADLLPLVVQTQLGADFPPTCIVHGTLDPIVEISESYVTYERLLGVGVKVEMIAVEGVGHGLLDQTMHPVAAAEDAQRRGIEFLEQELLGKTDAKSQ